MKNAAEKMRSQKGESISEVLIALLISSLALVMLSSMISSTQSMVSKSEAKMKEYYEQNENMEKTDGGDTATISIEGITGTTSVDYVVNDKLGTKVYAYGTPQTTTES